MGTAAYKNPATTINENIRDVTDSFNVTGSFNVWSNYEISVGDDKRQILEWLSPMAPRERHQAVCDGRVDGVGDWLLRTNEFKKWHTSEDQRIHPVLFCYGDPGVGKTYLRCVKTSSTEIACKTKRVNTSSLVIDTLCDSIDETNVAVACVYCDFHAHKEQSATCVLAAVLKQLVMAMEPVPEEITEAFERAKRSVGGRALRLPEIRALLVKFLSPPRRGFICIDALDEFPTKNRPELWHSLQHIVRECPNTQLFMTERPHIQDEVEKYFPGYPDLTPIKPTRRILEDSLL